MGNEIVARLQRLISEKVHGNGSAEPIAASTPLLSSGLNLDSIAVLELIMEIESEFGVEFRDSDMSVELFRTVGSLAAGVEERLAQGRRDRRQQ